MQIKKITSEFPFEDFRRPVYIVIPAAGLGLRMGISDSKQFLKIQDVPVLARTLLAFANFRNKMNLKIHAVLVTNQENLARAQKLVDTYQIDFVEKIVEGGATRQASVACGVAALATLERAPEADDQVFIHDGARCMVDTETLSNCYVGGLRYEVCVAATPCKNTIKCIRSNADNDDSSDAASHAISPVVDRTLDRNTLYEVQTPQVFRYHIISEVSEKAAREGISATDDTSLAEAFGIPVHLITCSYGNIKITTPEDVALAEFLLRQKAEENLD